MTTKYELRITGQFKRDLKRCKKRGLPLDELWAIIAKLLNGNTLEERYRAYRLYGDCEGQWECHIRPDWLLIWKQYEQELVLIMLNTGSHSELLGK